ncbi:MAG TPA: HD-GYP domain-containing protein [Thermotogota bacterium]|jgi:HD-GYP domain-containing protein (c-di-GMP phosphodiesterase class II)|nr:HD-GYP domain-containing protein [Thermotogota bacterium]NLH18471.1 HD-GYP domain-containing protein [Thermotogaceae bacterium]OQC30845.1 MAG: Cyclic di-GMP phosphodiesterase response regulator RpfG [Thermotogota bacterium ADurb.Bin062]HNW45971.1 HD-GYP domain-containing protein [Thermotogota bacterium]HNY81253.1 HD-GYP domain-containing protein [Thermotogota bacterium]
MLEWKRTSEIRAGDVIAETLTEYETGETIVHMGETVSVSIKERLVRHGIEWILTESRETYKSPIKPILSPEVLEEMEKGVKKVYDAVQREQKIPVEEVSTLSRQVVRNMLSNYGDVVVPFFSQMRTFDEYTFCHQVNVSIIAGLIAIEVYSGDRETAEAIVAGALIHDIGKLVVPKELLNKRTSLADNEFELMKKHVLYGHQMALDSGIDNPIILHEILYHHERIDGSGYLSGLKGREIPQSARIIVIADVFDALTSDRVYKMRWSPYQAIGYIIQQAGKIFDPYIASCFLRLFGIYPVGTRLLLSNGREVVVKGNRKNALTTPIVADIEQEEELIYLDRQKGLFVERVLYDHKED